MQRPLLIVSRGGIGDNLICSGIVNHLSETRKVFVACWKSWEPSLKWLYQDNKNIEIFPHQTQYLGHFHERDMNKLAAKLDAEYLGLCTTDVKMKEYYYEPYNQLKLPFEFMYSKFKLPINPIYNQEFLEKFKPKNPYVLLNIWDKIANRALINFNSSYVDPSLEKIYLKPRTNNLFDWIPIIRDASEIHSIPGGSYHLIDLIHEGKLFYHDARIGAIFNPNNEHNNNKWNIIKYKSKKAQ